MSRMLVFPARRAVALLVGATALLLVVLAGAAARAHPPATIAEADGSGSVEVAIVYYADLGCTKFASVREGAPGNIEPPQRTLVVTVTLDRQAQDCSDQPPTIEHKLKIADRKDALSVDIFFVDPDGRFVRSQRPRIYREIAECADKSTATETC